MGDVIVVIFDGPDDAEEARKSIRDLEKAGAINLEDAAVLVKDAEGKVHAKGETDKTVKQGAFWGGFFGLLIAFIFPIAGLAIGAIGGAIIGKMIGQHVDKQFVADVSEALKPGNSALFIMTRSEDPSAVVGALKPFKGTIFQTSVSPELEASLQSVLKD